MSHGTRILIWSVLGFIGLMFADRVAASVQNGGVSFSFKNVASEAGLVAKTIYGGLDTNQYLLETTGTGAAALDFDSDGWIDIFLVNGTTLEGFPPGKEPTNHLYRNKGNGTFEDVTARAGLAHGGWGQGACVGDYDNDGHDDLFVTYWGQNRLYRNKGDGAFEDATARAGLTQPRTRWGAGCAFLDYNRDGLLDIVAANYIDLDLKATPLPSSGLCRYKGLPVACGPPGLPGGKNVLYRNRGNGAFEDVSEASGIAAARGTYGLGVATVDFDNDGWLDVYVANDSNPSALYHNNRNGTFTDIGITAGCAYSQDGKPQAGMGVAIGDYDRNGTLDIFKTNFAGDTSTLYANTGKGACEDRTFAGGIGLNTRWLGWGVGFVDLDNDGWLDLFLVNGHVYPEVDRIKTEAGYKQRKVVYRNLKNGRFADVTEQLGPPVTIPKAGRGAAFADFDNDGDVDVVINNVHDTPDLYRLDQTGDRHWLTVKLVGAESNRSAIGARVQLVTADGVQVQEVRGGGSYYSQSDFRLLLRPRIVDGHRPSRGALAKRPRRDMDGARDRQITHAQGGFGHPEAGPVKSLVSLASHLILLGVVLRAGEVPVGATPTVQTQSAQASTAESQVKAVEARKLVDDGKPKEAIAKLEALDTSVPEVARLLGVAYYHADDHQQAIKQLVPLVSAKGTLPDGSIERREAIQVLGLCYYLTGRYPEAIPLLEETRVWAQDNLELGYILGLAYIQARQPDAARTSLARTFRLPPDSAGAHVIAAQMMLRLEMEPQAEAELKRAIEKDPRAPRANYLLGQTALFRGRLDEAIALTERELAANPGDAMALYQLGDAYLRASRADEAMEALQKSLWLNPYYSGPYILLGRLYLKKGQPATAEGMLRRAIQYDPNNRSAHYLLGQLAPADRAARGSEARVCDRRFPSAARTVATEGQNCFMNAVTTWILEVLFVSIASSCSS